MHVLLPLVLYSLICSLVYTGENWGARGAALTAVNEDDDEEIDETEINGLTGGGGGGGGGDEMVVENVFRFNRNVQHLVRRAGAGMVDLTDATAFPGIAQVNANRARVLRLDQRFVGMAGGGPGGGPQGGQGPGGPGPPHGPPPIGGGGSGGGGGGGGGGPHRGDGFGRMPLPGPPPGPPGGPHPNGPTQSPHHPSSSRSFFASESTLPRGTILNPQDAPMDYIAVVLFDFIVREVLLLLDAYAMTLVPIYLQLNTKNKKQQKGQGNFTPSTTGKQDASTIPETSSQDQTPLFTLAIRWVRLILSSRYRQVLPSAVFKPLITNCGLRVKMVADMAIKNDAIYSVAISTEPLTSAIAYISALECAYKDVLAQLFMVNTTVHPSSGNNIHRHENIRVGIDAGVGGGVGNAGSHGNAREAVNMDPFVRGQGGQFAYDSTVIVGYEHVRTKLESTVATLGTRALIDEFVEISTQRGATNESGIYASFRRFLMDGERDDEEGDFVSREERRIEQRFSKISMDTRRLIRIIAQNASTKSCVLVEGMWRHVVADWMLEICTSTSNKAMGDVHPTPTTFYSPTTNSPRGTAAHAVNYGSPGGHVIIPGSPLSTASYSSSSHFPPVSPRGTFTHVLAHDNPLNTNLRDNSLKKSHISSPYPCLTTYHMPSHHTSYVSLSRSWYNPW